MCRWECQSDTPQISPVSQYPMIAFIHEILIHNDDYGKFIVDLIQGVTVIEKMTVIVTVSFKRNLERFA
jgi:hypothetical protein